MQKFLINLLVALLARLGEYLIGAWKKAKKVAKIKEKQKAKEEATENAKTPEEIRAAHRNNKL